MPPSARWNRFRHAAAIGDPVALEVEDIVVGKLVLPVEQTHEGLGQIRNIGPCMADTRGPQILDHFGGASALDQGLTEPGTRDIRPEEIAGPNDQRADAIAGGVPQHRLHVHPNGALDRVGFLRAVLLDERTGIGAKCVDVPRKKNARAGVLGCHDAVGQHRHRLLTPFSVAWRIDCVCDDGRAGRGTEHRAAVQGIALAPVDGKGQPG